MRGVYMIENIKYFKFSGKELSLCHKLRFSNVPISLQPNFVNLKYFKLRIRFDKIIFV